MPRGVPKAGFRKSRNNESDNIRVLYTAKPETDSEISERLNERFEILDVLAQAATCGNARAFIVSGAPGLGKSFQIEKALNDYDPSGNTYTTVKGYVRATGLVKLLYEYRNQGNIIVFDDADSIFNDDISLNLLKEIGRAHV